MTLGALLSVGCLTPETLSCQREEDCYRDQFCVQGVCSDTQAEGPDSGTSPMCSAPDACVEDPYEKERSFSFDLTPEDTSKLGCVDADPVDFDIVVVGNVCASDTFGDFFGVPFAFCRDTDYVIEVKASATSCPPDAFEIEIDPDCGLEDCEVVDGGLQFTVRASSPRPSLTLPIRVKKLSPDAHIDYELSIRVLSE